MQIKLSKPSLKSQWVILNFGVMLPFWLTLLANWMISVAPSLLNQVDKYLQAVTTPETQPWIYRSLLFPLNANDGLWYWVIGVLLFIIALGLAVFVMVKSGAMSLELGKVRFAPIVISLLVNLMVVLAFVAIMNRAMFDSLLALQS